MNETRRDAAEWLDLGVQPQLDAMASAASLVDQFYDRAHASVGALEAAVDAALEPMTQFVAASGAVEKMFTDTVPPLSARVAEFATIDPLPSINLMVDTMQALKPAVAAFESMALPGVATLFRTQNAALPTMGDILSPIWDDREDQCLSGMLDVPTQEAPPSRLPVVWAGAAQELLAWSKTRQVALGATVVFLVAAWCFIRIAAGEFEPMDLADLATPVLIALVLNGVQHK